MSAENVHTWLYVDRATNTFQRTTAGGWWNPIPNAFTMLPMPLGVSAYNCGNPSMIFAYGGLNYPAGLGGRFNFTSPFAITGGDRINLGIPLSTSLDIQSRLTNTSGYIASGGFVERIPGIILDFNVWLNKGGPIYIPEVSGSGPDFYTGTVTTYAYVRGFMIKRHGVNEPYQATSPGVPADAKFMERFGL
jgi:hypothetical protein